MQTQEPAPKLRVQSAARTLGILIAVSRSANVLKAKEISEKLEISRQVAYHLIHTLLSIGALRRNHQNRYALGLAAGATAEGFARQVVPSEHLGGRVRELAAVTGETAYASGWIDGD